MVPQHLIPECALTVAAQKLRDRQVTYGIPVDEIPPAARPVTWEGLTADIQDSWRTRVAPAVGAALYAIDPSFADPHHVLLIGGLGWTMQHPLSCRPDLLSCPVPGLVSEQRIDATLPDGRYPVYVDRGRVTLGDAL